MLSVKYKMHKFVNLLFYFIIFSLGFLLGGGNLQNLQNVFERWFT